MYVSFQGWDLSSPATEFFKPNISTLLGNIYNREDLKPLKDNAYNIFYMGINIGALVCNFVAAYLRNKYSWGYAFAAAGIGMIIALITFGANLKHVRVGDIKKEAQKEDMPPFQHIPLRTRSGDHRRPHRLFPSVGHLSYTTIMGSPSSDAFVFACIPVVAFFISLWVRAKGQEKKGIGALLFIFAVSVIFWSLYYQNFTAYTLWAEKHTDRSISSRFTEKLADGMGLLQTVNTNPREVDRVDAHLVTLKDANGHTLRTIGPDPYYNNVPKDKWPPAGTDQKLANAELYQSIGPLFIVTLTPLLVLLFSYLRKRRKEPGTASKFGIALFLSGLSSLVMGICRTVRTFHLSV